jgi:hypothetical protein
MPDTLKTPWKRLSLEAAAIVASILLAFWIDAGWNQREDAARERVVLETVLADMREFQLAREARDEYLDAIIESSRSLLDIGRAVNSRATDREIDQLLNDITYTSNVVTKGLPVLDLLFEGGDLVTLESDALRARLADVRYSLSVELSYVSREVEFVNNILYPYLDANSSLAQIWGADDGQPGETKTDFNSTEFPYGREAIHHSEISHRELLENRQFQNILIRRILSLTNAKGWEDIAYDVDAQLRECIALIESALAD